jgi:shikimate kinase
MQIRENLPHAKSLLDIPFVPRKKLPLAKAVQNGLQLAFLCVMFLQHCKNPLFFDQSSYFMHPTLQKPIALVGYMGSGKTKLGKKLAQLLQWPFIDLDAAIEEFDQTNISELVTQRGELYFRKLERQILEQILTKTTPYVLSVGGGTPVYYNNMTLLLESCTVVYLQGNVGTLFQRLVNNRHERPLLAHLPEEELKEFIAKHLFERNPVYMQAPLHIPLLEATPVLIFEKISNYEQARSNS